MRRSEGGRGAPEVPRITSARESLSDDLSRRTHRYLLQMGLRVACFIGAVIVDNWTRWLLAVGAVILPYVAVVLANAGRSRGEDPGTFIEPRRIEGPGHQEDDSE